MAKGIVVSMKHHMKPHSVKPHHRSNGEKHRRRRRQGAAPAPPAPRPRTGMSRRKIIEESRRWLSIINAHKLNDY